MGRAHPSLVPGLTLRDDARTRKLEHVLRMSITILPTERLLHRGKSRRKRAHTRDVSMPLRPAERLPDRVEMALITALEIALGLQPLQSWAAVVPSGRLVLV